MNALETAESGPTFRPGVVVADKYRLLEAAGEGAMGTVWKAEHTSLGHTVAVKFLHGSVANAAEPRARFEREARLAAKLGEASRHITRVTDHGVTPDGTPFLVMEFLHGEGLEVRLKRERRLPMTLVAKITSQLSRALFVAHAAGVIHRDLKPANVFLCDSPEDGGLLVKLLDFGVAKATLENEENQATRAGALIGTPNYMSPEQITGHTVDARSDLFGLAGIVYRMAVGKAPFGSGALSELAMRIVATEPPAPTSLAPDLPAEFDLWVKKALAKKPEDRFQNARDLSDSLAMVSGITSSGSTGAFSAAAAERLALQLGDSMGGLQSTLGHSGAVIAEPAPKRRSRAPVIVAVVAAAVLAAAAVFLVRGRQEVAPPASAAAASATSNTAPTAPTPVVTTPEPATTPTPSVSAEPEPPPSTTADKPVEQPKPGKSFKVVGTKPTAATTTTKPETTAAPPPPPPPEPTQKSGDLWKKKDEM